MQDQVREVKDFTKVAVRGSGRLHIEQDGTESLTITADENLLPYLTAEVKEGRLVLGTKPGVNIQPTRPIEYRLSVKKLDGIEIAGSANVLANHLDTDALNVNVSGSGDLDLHGRAEKQEITVSGSGKYAGADLKTRNASVNISGSGAVVVAVSDQLNVRVSGSGSVEYIGEPQVTRHIAGSGSVKKR